jgi:hypothetical protein
MCSGRGRYQIGAGAEQMFTKQLLCQLSYVGVGRHNNPCAPAGEHSKQAQGSPNHQRPQAQHPDDSASADRYDDWRAERK